MFNGVTDMDVHCMHTGRWDSARVAIAADFATATMKCDVLADAVCGGWNRLVQIVHGNIPIFLWNRFWVVRPHLGNDVGGAFAAWGLILRTGRWVDVAGGGGVITVDNRIRYDANA